MVHGQHAAAGQRHVELAGEPDRAQRLGQPDDAARERGGVPVVPTGDLLATDRCPPVHRYPREPPGHRRRGHPGGEAGPALGRGVEGPERRAGGARLGAGVAELAGEADGADVLEPGQPRDVAQVGGGGLPRAGAEHEVGLARRGRRAGLVDEGGRREPEHPRRRVLQAEPEHHPQSGRRARRQSLPHSGEVTPVDGARSGLGRRPLHLGHDRGHTGPAQRRHPPGLAGGPEHSERGGPRRGRRVARPPGRTGEDHGQRCDQRDSGDPGAHGPPAVVHRSHPLSETGGTSWPAATAASRVARSTCQTVVSPLVGP